MTSRLHLSLLLGVALALAVTGCGRRGSLERPAGAPAAEQPHGEDGTAAEATKDRAPKRSFILDPLIR